jgi:allophanate hydrolase
MSVLIHRAEPPAGDGPLAVVKDNIDVAGMPTTAGCPSYAYTPGEDAPCVARLRARGARILGKANLDQFATGLVGTRTPYGVPANPFDAQLVPGGSSSGSAVAVATGMCRIALGTDTAGSGRIPAAFTNIVGLKPTRGWVSTRGVVPACRSLDCVSVFALSVQEAWRWLETIAGYDPADPQSRRAQHPALPSGALRIGIPAEDALGDIDARWREAWHIALAVLRRLGHSTVEIDYAPFAEAAAALYGGAWVAERTAAVGEFLAGGPAGADPTVSGIILGGRRHDAAAAFRDAHRMAVLRRAAEAQWERMDLLCLPTAPGHPSLAEVAADPVGANARLGRFTNFANLLDTCAAAVPAALIDGLPQGVTLFAPAWHDLLAARTAAALQDALHLPLGASARRLAAPQIIAGDDGMLRLAVFGAHMTGQPLNRQIVELGGRFERAIATDPCYRLYALRTVPPRPGLLRVASGGASISGELWRLPPAGFAAFVASIPAPLGIGRVQLADDGEESGFLAEAAACAEAEDITVYGSWPAWLAARG